MSKHLFLAFTVLLFACNNPDVNSKQGEGKKADSLNGTSNTLETCEALYLTIDSNYSQKSFMGQDTIILNSTKVILTVKSYTSTSHPNLRSTADSAVYIASVLLNSNEFQDSIRKLTFTCRNFKRSCEKQCETCDSRFNGSVVLDSAYRSKNVSLDLILDSINGTSFGSAAMNIFKITSHYPVIRRDDKSLPFSYSYAYHIAHEYMHIVGFTHNNHKEDDDVAAEVGIKGYRIIKRWHKAGINPMSISL